MYIVALYLYPRTIRLLFEGEMEEIFLSGLQEASAEAARVVFSPGKVLRLPG